MIRMVATADKVRGLTYRTDWQWCTDKEHVGEVYGATGGLEVSSI